MGKKLPKSIADRIDSLSETGNETAQRGEYEAARQLFIEALKLVPEPKTDWEATTWLVASIGDMLFQQGDLVRAQAAFEDAVRCPGGLGNAFIHLRLGEIRLELADEPRAADNLARAYMAGGREVFRDEDPKYFALVERTLQPPKGCDRLP